MICSKIGGECPHPVGQDNHLVFVMMPFKGFNNEYYAIQTAVEGIEGKNFKCLRADKQYTTFQIWCQSICKNIRKAKYLIVDTTGKNPNVFYELGFSHALESTRAILITKNVEDAPFDISDLNHIEYSSDNLRQLEEDLKNAVLELEKEEVEEGDENKSSDEMILELKSQLRDEEGRASKFKKELHESEERERKLKERLKEIEAITSNPVKEAKNQITKLEGTIAEFRNKLKVAEKSNREEIDRLNRTLEEKEKNLKILKEELDASKNSKDKRPLLRLLLSESRRKTKSEKCFNKGLALGRKGNYGKAIDFYTKAVALNQDYVTAYENLTELHIITGNYISAFKCIKTALNLPLEKKHRAVCLYLECITKMMLDMDVSESEREFNNILKKNFKTTWSFDVIKPWIADAEIDKDKKAYIIEKTEKLKKHKV